MPHFTRLAARMSMRLLKNNLNSRTQENSRMINTGDLAPDFTLSDQDENEVTLSGLRGQTVVLFFYPKADTSGCTTEACGFRDHWAQFGDLKVTLLGISPDAVKSQQKFAAKFGLPMRLLADVGHLTADAYGVWVQKTLYGRAYMGVSRETFVIDPEGIVSHVFRKVKVDAHAGEVLKVLREAAQAAG